MHRKINDGIKWVTGWTATAVSACMWNRVALTKKYETALQRRL